MVILRVSYRSMCIFYSSEIECTVLLLLRLCICVLLMPIIRLCFACSHSLGGIRWKNSANNDNNKPSGNIWEREKDIQLFSIYKTVSVEKLTSRHSHTQNRESRLLVRELQRKNAAEDIQFERIDSHSHTRERSNTKKKNTHFKKRKLNDTQHTNSQTHMNKSNIDIVLSIREALS